MCTSFSNLSILKYQNTLMKSVSTATQLSQDLVDESVELVKVHEGGAVELVMKYGDIYELTIQSIKEVQEAM